MKILITGISGFLAEEIVPRLIREGHEVVGIARNEGKLLQLKQKYPQVTVYTGDLADKWVVKKAMQGCGMVIHAGAYKHVGMAEENVFQCIKSNIIGSISVLEESFDAKPAIVVGISTDKAAQPTGVYGKSKQLMEKLFEEAGKMNKQTSYLVVRYGNVLGSTGSILPLWKEKISKGEPIKITNPDATRFFFTVSQAVDLIFECVEKSKDATPYIPEMKAMKIGDFAEAVMQKYGRVPVETIGLGEGENMHEKLSDEITSDKAELYTIEEIKQLI